MQRKSVKILLMRHAQSEFNKAAQIYSKKYGKSKENYDQVHFSKDPIFTDANLSDFGREQATQAQSTFEAYKDLKYVFSSPFRRAVKTAKFALEKYPKKTSWRLFPLIREAVHYSCDLALHTEDVLKEYSDIERTADLDDKLWFLKNIEKIEEKENPHLEAIQLYEETKDHTKLIELMEKIYPNYLENDEQAMIRIKKSKVALKEFVNKKLEDGEEVKDCEILVVAHVATLRHFTATKWDSKHYPSDGYQFDNAEVREYELEL